MRETWLFCWCKIFFKWKLVKIYVNDPIFLQVPLFVK